MDNYCIFLLCALMSFAAAHERIVQTSYGKIKGTVSELNGKAYTEFLGVPFAAPPVGGLRFKPPQRHVGWGDDVRDARNIEWPAGPQQPNVTFEEPLFPEK